MTEPDTSYIAKVVINAYDSETNKYSALAEVVRSIADELGYHLFLPGDDCREVDVSSPSSRCEFWKSYLL